AQVIHGSPDVEVRARPPAARLAESAVLDVPGGDAIRLERVGHRGEVASVRVRGLEAAAMDEDDYRMRPGARRDAQLSGLTRVCPVRNTPVRRTAGERLEILRGHQVEGIRRRIGRTHRPAPAPDEQSEQRGGHRPAPVPAPTAVGGHRMSPLVYRATDGSRVGPLRPTYPHATFPLARRSCGTSAA